MERIVHLRIDWSDEFLCDEISVWQNVRVTKCLVTKSLVTKCHVTKCLCDEKSCDEKSCDEMSCDEMSVWRNVNVTKCLVTKCHLTKCLCDDLSMWPNVLWRIVRVTNCLWDEMSVWRVIRVTKLLWRIKTRGKSFSEKVYKIFIKTIRFLCDFCRNNRISLKGVRDFSTLIYPSVADVKFSAVWQRPKLNAPSICVCLYVLHTFGIEASRGKSLLRNLVHLNCKFYCLS